MTVKELIAKLEEYPDDYVIQHSRNTPKCPKG